MGGGCLNGWWVCQWEGLFEWEQVGGMKGVV